MTQSMAQLYTHPRNPHSHIWGIMLKEGDTLQDGDYYAASNGKWEPVTCVGIVLQKDCGKQWVRMC